MAKGGLMLDGLYQTNSSGSISGWSFNRAREPDDPGVARLSLPDSMV